MNRIDPLKLMSGVPIFLEEINLNINQPKIKDIAVLGEVQFYQGLSYFLMTKEKLKIDADISDFDLFMKIINQENSIQKDVSDIFILIIDGLQSIKFYDTFIIVNVFGQECIIDEPKFSLIKETLVEVFCLENKEAVEDLNPANKQARDIAEKIKQRRLKLAGDSKGKTDQIFAHLVSVLSIGSNTFNLEDCLNLTVFQIFNLIKRYFLYDEHQKQIQALLQGAKDIDLAEWTKQF
jgi:hypothetical protein